MSAVQEKRALAPAPQLASTPDLRAAALKCMTPSQMARLFDVGAGQVTAMVRDRLAIRVSHGALRGSTYTKADIAAFDADAKGRLFELIRAEVGEDAMSTAAQRVNWYETTGGNVAEGVLDVADVGVEHISYLRKPIKSIDYWMAWSGRIASVVVMVFTFFVLFPLYLIAKRSFEAWEAAKVDRPRGAIVVGWLTLPVALPVWIPALAVMGVRRLVRLVRDRR